jgi:hypothetical protein
MPVPHALAITDKSTTICGSSRATLPYTVRFFLFMRQNPQFTPFFTFSMKIPFLSVGLSLVLLGTTFCTRDYSDPTPATTRANSKDSVQPYPIGFNPQTCSADPNGVSGPLYQEARNNAYYLNGSQISDAEFSALQAAASSTPSPSVDANGHVSGTAYDTRLNNFSDGVKAQMDEYNYYVYYASLHGANVQSEEDVKAIIQEQFEQTIPVQPYESLSQATQNDIALITSAARPQLEHALQLFSSVYRCENVYSRSAPTDGSVQKGTAEITFKQFLSLRKAGKIGDMSGVIAQRGFWSSLKKAVHIAVSLVVWTVVAIVTEGPKFEKVLCGSSPSTSCTTISYFLAGATGLGSSITKIANNNCIFGGC